MREYSCPLAVYYPDASQHPAVLSRCGKDLMTEHIYVPVLGLS